MTSHYMGLSLGIVFCCQVYAPMLRELFNTVVELVLQKVAHRVSTGKRGAEESCARQCKRFTTKSHERVPRQPVIERRSTPISLFLADKGSLELWRLINHIVGYDLDGELDDVFRYLLFGAADDLLRRWPTMPVGSPVSWQQP